MNLTIFGTGYVGLVTGACLANSGHQVACIDIDQERIERLKKGEIPIFEPGLEEIVKESVANNLLSFTRDTSKALRNSEVCFVCVGTPDNGDGSTDLSQVTSVVEDIKKNLSKDLYVFIKSTVPVGTCRKIQESFDLYLEDSSLKVKLASNPEFLKEGSAVEDFNRPDRIIVGSDFDDCIKVTKEIYGASNRIRNKVIFMKPESSEMAKYASNAMLATRISFMNELARFASSIGADIEEVRSGMGSDPRIGDKFLYAGCGFGGSCFPKDLKSFIKQAKKKGDDFSILSSVEEVNREQKDILFKMARKQILFNNQTKVALWGLSYKPNTDDIREAPSLNLISSLSESGSQIKAYDPKATNNIKTHFGNHTNLTFCDNKYETLIDAEVLFICTEWKEFWKIDFARLVESMKTPFIVDGRNIYEPKEMRSKGIKYMAIGRNNYS